MSSATLRLTRRWSLFVGSPYEVLVDDQRIGAVQNDAAMQFIVAPGRHTLQVRAGRFCSAIQSFDAYEGADVEFWCRGVRLWPVYVVALVRPQYGITLRSVERI